MTIQKKCLYWLMVPNDPYKRLTIEDFMPVDENMRIVLFHISSGIPEEYRELEKNPTCVSAVSQLKSSFIS
jgi:hypothetical protein